MLREKLKELVRDERKSNAEVIRSLREVQLKGLHLEWGYSSLFHYCMAELGYSNAAASRRVSTVYLALDVPQVSDQIESGKLSLNRAQAISNFIKKEKDQAGVKYTKEQKSELYEAAKACTQEQAEQLFAQRTEIMTPKFQEKKRVLETGETHAHLKYSVELKEKIKHVKDLLTSSRESLTDSELFELLLEDFIERKDPVKRASRIKERMTNIPRKTSPDNSRRVKSPQRTRLIPAAARHALALTTPQKCQYQDPRTGAVCGSTKRLETDHKLPFSKGGGHEPSNLTYLCKSHNLRKADTTTQ
jgi:5-methylcytosine-specific restriction endonuclease McrA